MPSSNIKRKKKPVSNNATNGSNFTETAMDEFLARLNLYRKPIAKDGSCLFRAVSEQVYNCQAKHLQVRKDCIDFMRRNRDKFEAFLEGPFDHHLFRLQNPKEWAGQVEISALSLMYKKDFVVYQDINAEPTKVTDNNFKDKILLCYSNGNHYDAVYNIQFQKDAALCQSMVYEILYQRVFSELDRKENLRGSKHNQSTDMNSMMALYQNGLGEDDSFKEDSEDNSGWTEVVRGRSNKAKSARHNRGYEQEEMKDEAAKPSLDQKHGWQAKRSLDTELYRNVELEVWEDSKNGQEQQDRSYAASIQYQPGDKCFAWLGRPDVADKVYEAIVVFNLPIQGNIEVKVPELHNKSFVIPLENLKPSDSQQDLHYRELSGYYKKSESAAGGDGSREDGKRGGRRRNLPPRPPRGVKGDEQGEDGAARKGFQDEPFGRPRGGPGSRDKFGRGRGRGRYPRGRDERQLHREDEDAKLIAEQAKLAELQEKDPAAFPALPTQLVEEKPLSSTEAAPDQSPAEFWSRLKNTQGKPATTPPKELNQAGASTDDKLPSPLTNHQLHTAKLEEKRLETRKEKPLTKEPKVPVPETSETGNKEGEAVKKIDVQAPETNSSRVALESSKTEKSEAVKPVMSPEKDLVRDKMEVSKGALLIESKQPVTAPSTELKVTVQKPTTEEVKLVDVSEARTAWSKEMLERKEPKPQESSVKEHEMETKKTEEPPPVKPGVRGLIRMTNLNNKPQQASETKDQVETHKDDVKLVRKEDTPSLKSALAGEGPTSVPEKKTVTFAEPLNEGGEIKVLLNTAKDLAGKDGKREILAPPTLVSVVMKPAPASEISAQQENPSISILAPSKNTLEDETTTTQSSIPNNHASAKSQTPSSTPTDTNQSSEEAQPAPSSSPTVSQHQASYSLPILTYLFSHVPNMTSQPRMPQGISVESDGSDLPEDPNTLRYFFNLGFSYHMQLCQQQQWANQQMMYYPQMYPVPSQDHLQPHPAVSMGQQLSPGVPQMMYPTQQMQTYHPAQVPPVMQENTSFSDRSSMDRNSSGQTQQQQQHQTPPFMNQHPPHHAPWRNARSMTGYQSKQMHLGGYNSQVQNQQTPRGPMQQGAGNNKPHFKQKKYPKHRNDQYLYNAQSQHAQNQGPMVQGAHAYSNAPQTAGSSSNAFYMASGDHSASKSSGDYYHGPQQFSNFHSNVSSNLSQGPHSTAANLRAQYP